MSPRLLLPLTALLLAGCMGQVRDFVGSRADITWRQFTRYGLNGNQARCMGERIGEVLTPLQLRRFARAAGALRQGPGHPAPLAYRDIMWVANTMGDAAVPRALDRADSACGLTAAEIYARELQRADELARQRDAAVAAAAAPRAPNWLNLGAAGSGQSIAVDASTLVREGNTRTAWFRMTDPGAATSPDAYLLAIDCARRTINARARERRAADGSVAERVDYPDNPLPVEGGTVMEIAFLSSCT